MQGGGAINFRTKVWAVIVVAIPVTMDVRLSEGAGIIGVTTRNWWGFGGERAGGWYIFR